MTTGNREPDPAGRTGRRSGATIVPSTRTAIRFAGHLHRIQRRASDDAPFILHPLEVASLLYNCGAPERVVTAGVLHDVIEDTEDKFEHYAASLAMLEEVIPEQPLVRHRCALSSKRLTSSLQAPRGGLGNRARPPRLIGARGASGCALAIASLPR